MKRARCREAREVRTVDGQAAGPENIGCGMESGIEDRLNTLVARVFWEATTRHSSNIEDILPQEGGQNGDHSVFHVFALVFPEIVGAKGAGACNKRMRLHFNKIGYKMYGKEQSRRVPSHNAKPGNPGYGFRRARWRDTLHNEQDRIHCENMLESISCDGEQIERVKKAVQEYQQKWEIVRRPSRPAGPGRPRRAYVDEDSGAKLSDGSEEDDLPPAGPDVSGKKRPADMGAAAHSAGTSQHLATGIDLWWSLADIAGSKRARSEVGGGKQPSTRNATALPLHIVSGANPLSSAFPLHLAFASPFLQQQSTTLVLTGGAAGYVRGGQTGWSPIAFPAAGGSGVSLLGQSGASSLTLPPLRLHGDQHFDPVARHSSEEPTSQMEDLPGLVRDKSVERDADSSALHALASLVCATAM